MAARLHLFVLKLFRRLPRSARLSVVRVLSPSFTVGAICVIERSDGAILLVRHSYRKRWGFPGGLLERGEGAAAGARREASEEVGLDVTLVGEPAVVVEPMSKRVDVVFRAQPVEGVDPDTVRCSSPEIVDAAWFSPDDMPELQHEASGALVALARATGAPAPRPPLAG